MKKIILYISFIFHSTGWSQQNIEFDSLATSYDNFAELDSCELSISFLNQLIKIKPNLNLLYEHKIRWLKKHDCYNIDSIYWTYDKLIQLEPESKDYYFARGSALHWEKGEENFKKALKDFEKVISLDSFYFPAYEHVQTYYFYENAPKSAKVRKVMRRKMEEAVKVDSLNALYWHWLGKAWDICNNSSGAKIPIQKLLDCQNKAIDLDSNIGAFYWERGLIYYELNKYDKCISDMQKANSFVSSTIYITYISICYEKKGELEKAIQILDEGLIEFPEHFQLVNAKKQLQKKMKPKK